MGRSPEALHYHLVALKRVGLIREAFRRPAPKKPEAVYEPVHRSLRLPGREAPAARRLVRKAVLAGMRATMRGFEAASIRAEQEPAGRSYSHVIRANVHLSDEDAREFMEMLEAASRFALEKRRDDGVRMQWSSILYELPPHGE